MSKAVRILQLVHLAVVLAAIITVFLLHLYTQNFLDFLRVPIFLKTINPFLGFGWPASLHVYQTILVMYVSFSLVNSLGLLFYSQKLWRILSDLFSFLAILIIWPAGLFFILTLASSETLNYQAIKTIIIYFTITTFLFILNLVTWYVDEQSIRRFKSKVD